jgi:hypothetical protein
VIGTVEITDEDMAERLLEQCERELDLVLIRNTFATTDIRHIDPTLLMPYQATALMRATCAQFEYHRIMGEDLFVKPQPQNVRQPEGGGYDGRLAIIAPKAFRELTAWSPERHWLHRRPELWEMDIFGWQRSWLPTAMEASRSFNTLSRR